MPRLAIFPEDGDGGDGFLTHQQVNETNNDGVLSSFYHVWPMVSLNMVNLQRETGSGVGEQVERLRGTLVGTHQVFVPVFMKRTFDRNLLT